MSKITEKTRILIVATIFAGIISGNCATSLAAVAKKSSWNQEWDKLLVDAKKEGKVIINSSAGPSVRNALSNKFTGDYGITLEFISGKPEELVPKLLVERRAGIYSSDMFIGGHSVIANLGPQGLLESLDAVLMLPEVIDKKAWWGGDLPWADANHFQVMFLAYPTDTLWVNKDMVKNDEIKSFTDLLKPLWKGKISYRDPTMSGSGNESFTFIRETLPNGLDFLRDLVKQEPAFSRDARLQTEWTARGKYPVAIGLKGEEATEFVKLGAPIRVNQVVEGTYITAQGGGLALMVKAPHPKATAVFINWLLSKEGGTVFSRAWGGQSAREDVPTDFLEPYVVRKAGLKYTDQVRGEQVKKQSESQKLAREIYRDFLK